MSQWIAMTLLAALAASVCPGGATAATDPYLWKYRPVVIFAPDDADTHLARQRAIVSAQGAALRERNVVVVYVVGNAVSQQFGLAPNAGASALRTSRTITATNSA